MILINRIINKSKRHGKPCLLLFELVVDFVGYIFVFFDACVAFVGIKLVYANRSVVGVNAVAFFFKIFFENRKHAVVISDYLNGRIALLIYFFKKSLTSAKKYAIIYKQFKLL